MTTHTSLAQGATRLPAEASRHGFVVRGRDVRGLFRGSEDGATMLVILMFIMAATIAVTGMMHLTAARLQQSGQVGTVTQRHLRWENSRAVNRQYMFTWAMRDDVTRAAVSCSLGDWGGASDEAFGHLRAFATKDRASNGSVSYPFNNLRPPGTSDGGVYYERTDGSTDSSQTERLTFYNYLKTYPGTLIDDLFVVHKKPSSASGTYSIAGTNFQVNGRVLLYDDSATVSSMRAARVLHGLSDLTDTTKNTANTASQLPENYPVRPTVTAGYGGSGTPYAVTDGTLNHAYNPNFPAGSLRDIITNSGSWMTGTTSDSTGTNVETDESSGSSSSDIQVVLDTSPYTYPPPTTAPYAHDPGSTINRFHVRLGNAGLKHLRIVSGVEQLVIDGQTTAATYTAAASLPPLIISVEQTSLRDIRFVGENSRPFILAFDEGAGLELYLGFESASLVSGGGTRWRMQLSNEHRSLWLDSQPNGVLITGGLRTNWQVNCADPTTSVRYTWQRDTEPDRLAPYMPRDGWLETFLVPQ